MLKVVLRCTPSVTDARSHCCGQVDYPDGERLMHAELDFKQKCARGDMRRFLASAVEDREMSKMGEEVVVRISQALDEAEKETGPLVSTNKKAGEVLGKKFKVRITCFNSASMMLPVILALLRVTGWCRATHWPGIRLKTCRRSLWTSMALER